MGKIKKTFVLLITLLFISAASFTAVGCDAPPPPEEPPPEEIPETPTEP